MCKSEIEGREWSENGCQECGKVTCQGCQPKTSNYFSRDFGNDTYADRDTGTTAEDLGQMRDPLGGLW